MNHIIAIYSVLILLSGVTLNLIAVTSNENRMPVLTENFIDTKTHYNYTQKNEVQKWYLTDIINLKGKNNILHLSIGDLLLLIGFTIYSINLIYYNYNTIKKWRKK